MENNDVLRRLRYTFDLSDSQMIDIFKEGDLEVTRSEVSNWLKKDSDPDHESLHDKKLAYFLNGFINKKRGKKEGPAAVAEKTLTNNLIFRKLKIALNLKDDDILAIFKLAGLNVGKHELSAIFRNPKQSQFRLCKDQFLRNFLNGLQMKFRNDS